MKIQMSVGGNDRCGTSPWTSLLPGNFSGFKIDAGWQAVVAAVTTEDMVSDQHETSMVILKHIAF